MKNQTRKIGVGLLMALCCMGFVDAGTDGNFSVTLGIGNSAPDVTWVGMIDASANPTQNSYTTVSANFTVTDVNGHADLNSSSAHCFLNDGISRDSTSCAKTVIDATSAYFVCGINLQYYDTPGAIWDLTCAIDDNNGGTDSMQSLDAFTYNTLTAMALDQSAVSFGTLSVGATVGALDDPVAVFNQGNVAIVNVSLKGYGLSSGGNTLAANRFNATVDDLAGTGAPVVENTYVQVPSMAVSVGSGTYDELWLWVSIPTGQAVGTYTSTSDWVVAVNPV